MIWDKDSYWVRILPKGPRDFATHYPEKYGKCIIHGSRKSMERLVQTLNPLVESGKIDQAKYTKKDSRFDPFPHKKMYVMCVYCSYGDRYRVWRILKNNGFRRRTWKSNAQTDIDWSYGGKLDREARKLNGDLNEKIPEQCTMRRPNDLVSLDGDYLVRFVMRDLENILPVEQDKIVNGIKQTYGIRDDSCASAILGHIKGYIPFTDMCEFYFYRVLYRVAKKWSKGTVRKNLKRFEELGLLKRKYFHELGFHEWGEDYRTTLMKIFGLIGEKPTNLDRERVFITEIYLPESILTQAPKPDDHLIISDVKTIKEGDELYSGRGEHLVDKIDLRGLSDKEKRRVIADFVQQPFLGINLEKNYYYTHEQRIRIVSQVAEEAKNLPHIIEMYSVGSFPNNEDRKNSDVDILVVRDRCPGYGNCGARLRKADAVDLFCFSEEEMEMARKRKLAILLGAEKLYDNSSLMQSVPTIS